MSLFIILKGSFVENEIGVFGVEKTISQILGGKFELQKRVALGERTLALIWNLKGGRPVYVKQMKGIWYVLTGQINPLEFENEINFYGSAGIPCYFQPVWGRYLAVIGSATSKAVYGWQTTPCMESVCYATYESDIFISNSPLLCNLALGMCKTGSPVPRYSHEAVEQYLAFGYTVGKTTMFRDVHQVLPRHLVKLVPKSLPVQYIGPAGLSHSLPINHDMVEAAEALESALCSSFQRAIVGLNNPIDMRVSGGKDSRIMLGLARKFGVPVVATCVGDGTDWDTRIAAQLTKMAGYKLISRGYSVYNDDPWVATLKSLRATLGVPQSEAHYTPYEFTSPEMPGQTLMFGNWPAYHGVYHRKMAYTAEEIRKITHSVLSASVTKRVWELQATQINDWMDELSTPTMIHKLYEFGLVYRGSNWMKPAFSGYSSNFNCAFFMSDQECTALADKLTMFEHISYAPEFLVLKNIWPNAVRIPLAQNMWRFEANGPSQDSMLDPEGYPERLFDARLLEVKFPKYESSYTSSSFNVYSSHTITLMMKYLCSSSIYHAYIRDCINVSMQKIISNQDLTLTKADKIFVWRVFALTCALSNQWFYEI